MKIDEVPQDDRYLGHTSVRDFYYATDEGGNYRMVGSVGWEVKNEALALTWDNISEEAEDVRRDVLAGKVSPLAYHMAVHLLDAGLLAAYSGIAKKQIKKHLQPAAFQALADDVLQIYADVMQIPVAELKQVKE
jgi:hypothetical protein